MHREGQASYGYTVASTHKTGVDSQLQGTTENVAPISSTAQRRWMAVTPLMGVT